MSGNVSFVSEVYAARRCPTCGGVRPVLLTGDSRNVNGVAERRTRAIVRACELSICPDRPGPTLTSEWTTVEGAA